MKKLFLTGAILAGLTTFAYAQHIEIGPGGFSINPGRERNWGRECTELRYACEYKDERGERGEGNCRRYRELCGR